MSVQQTKQTKPLGRKNYGSIGHLPNSRLGPGDHCVTEGQARICTIKPRDKHDLIIVQEKLDGSNTGVALIDGTLHALTRAGYPAKSSPHEQHHLFAQWVWNNEARFRAILRDGERLVGEWLAQAHGTMYDLAGREPWAAFDLMVEDQRLPFAEFSNRVVGTFAVPTLLHVGSPIGVDEAMKLHDECKWPCDETEGLVYRVERKGKIDFLAKWVKPTKVDGKYLESVTGKPPVWNWRP